MKLNIRPTRSSSALHNERCNTLISELERRGVEPGIIQAFRKLVKSNSPLRALLRTEQRVMRKENNASFTKVLVAIEKIKK